VTKIDQKLRRKEKNATLETNLHKRRLQKSAGNRARRGEAKMSRKNRTPNRKNRRRKKRLGPGEKTNPRRLMASLRGPFHGRRPVTKEKAGEKGGLRSKEKGADIFQEMKAVQGR